MLDESIASSPEGTNKSLHNKRLHRKHKRRRVECEAMYDENSTPMVEELYSQTQTDRTDVEQRSSSVQARYYDASYDPFAEQKQLALADRLYCARAPSSQRSTKNNNNASKIGFQKCENIQQLSVKPFEDCIPINSEPMPCNATELGITDTELTSICDEAIAIQQSNANQSHFQTPMPSTPKNQIVQEILRDFCSSPTPSEELASILKAEANVSPRFRYAKTKLRTYSRVERASLAHKTMPSPKPSTSSHIDDDSCLSVCSSVLSMQEGYTQSLTKGPEVDLNKTQQLCKNLMNLSQFFTQKSDESVEEEKTVCQDSTTTQRLSADTLACSQLLTQVLNLNKAYFSNSPRAKWNSTEDFMGFEDIEGNSNEPKTIVERCIDLPPPCEEDIANTTFLVVPMEFKKKYSFGVVGFETKVDESPPKPSPKSVARNFCDKEIIENDCMDDWHNDSDFFASIDSQKLLIKAEQPSEPHTKLLEALQDTSASFEEKITIKAEGAHEAVRSPATVLHNEDWNTDCDFMAHIQTQDLAGPKTSHDVEELINTKTVWEDMQLSEWPLDGEIQTHNSKPTNVSHKESETDSKKIGANPALQCEKVEFLGFRTASSKRIQVSEEAEKKAANILKDLPPLTVESELPQLPDKVNNGLVNDQLSINSKEEFIGFRTASSKTIKISKEAEKRAANILKELPPIPEKDIQEFREDQPSISEKEEFIGFRTASSKTIKISKEAEKRAANFLKELPPLPEKDIEETANNHPSTSNKEEYVGFRTASSKTIKISKETEKRAANILKELPPLPEKDIEESENDQPSISNKEEFIGFRTASSKSIKISKDAEKRAANILKELPPLPEKDIVEFGEDQPSISNKEEFIGFRTASSKTIKISKEAEKRAANILKELPPLPKIDIQEFGEDQPSISNKEEFIGFRTASSKTIKISKEAEKRAANILKELPPLPEKDIEETGNDQPSISNKEEFIGFRTASSKSIKISKEAEKRAANILKELPPLPEKDTVEFGEDQPSISNKEEFIGFRTASSKTIKISKEAEKRAANILKELPPIPEKDIQEFREDQPSISEKEEFIGFRTASSKTIKISKEAEKRAANILKELPPLPEKDIEETANNHPSISNKEEYVGFRTASSKSIKISKEAKKQAANILKELPPLPEKDIVEFGEDQPSISNKEEFIGFRTASSKTIKISKEAEKRAANILKELPPLPEKDIEETANNHPSISNKEEFVGFRTASSKSIKISKEAEKRAANILKELPPLPEKHLKERVDLQSIEELPTIPEKHVEELMDSIFNEQEKQLNNEENDFIGLNASTKLLQKSFTMSTLESSPQQCEQGKLKSNLTDLATCSPLAKGTASSIIARKNLLSLSKKRKTKHDAKKNERLASNSTNSISTPIKTYEKPQEINTPNMREFLKQAPEGNTSTPLPRKLVPKTISTSKCDDGVELLATTPKNKVSYLNTSQSKTETDVILQPSPQDRIARLQLYGDPPAITPVPAFNRSNCRPSGLRRTRSGFPTPTNNNSL